MFKWIVTDLDGTLLGFSDKTGVSFDTNTGKILNRVIATKKYEFTIATGRHYLNVLDIVKQFDIKLNNKSYIIGMNGAQIYSCAEKKLIHNVLMDNASIKKFNTLIQYLEKHYKDEYLVFGYQDKDFAMFFHDSGSKFYKTELARMVKYENGGKSLQKTVTKDFSNLDKVFKIIVTLNVPFNYEHECAEFAKIFPEMSFAKSSSRFIEIFPNTINKRIALEYINDKYFHFKTDEILGFGDSYNDIEFLSWVGTSVTRESTEQTIKDLCGYVIDAPESTFVGDALNLLLGAKNED